MFYQLISAEENGAIIMMLLMFCLLFYREYRQAQREGLKHIVIMNVVCNGWLLLLYSLDIFSYVPRVMDLFLAHRIVHLSANLMIVPLLFVTLTLQTKRKTFSWGWISAHIAPFLLAMIVGLFTNNMLLYYFIFAAAIVYGTVFIVVTARAAYRYSMSAKDEYSSLDGRSFRWLHIIPFVLGILLPSYALYCYYRSIEWLSVYQMLSILLWGCYNAFSLRMVMDRNRTTEDLDYLDSQMLSEDDYKEEELHQETPATEPFAQRLKRVCEDGELYLNEDFNREDLARAMNTNHTYLTRLLQQEMGTNFYTYINSLRAKRAKALILMHPDWTMEQVAFNCGYRSRTTFTNAFQRIEGMTPLDWKNGQG